MNILPLSGADFSELYEAFRQAFADYEIQLDSLELETMLKRRGFTPDLSFGAFEDRKLVAFTFNGIGSFRGIGTAYDTGTGTLPEFRGKGLAGKIFEASIPFLREAGVEQYLLEVLQHNEKAVSLYRKLGFRVTREFNYFVEENSRVKMVKNLSDPGITIGSVTLPEILEHSGFMDFIPSWQNDLDSVQRTVDDFTCFGAYYKNKLVGYCICDPGTGDLTQIAVDPLWRRKGIGTALVRSAVKENRHRNLKMINTESGHDGINRFMESLGLPCRGKQFEMIRSLN